MSSSDSSAAPLVCRCREMTAGPCPACQLDASVAEAVEAERRRLPPPPALVEMCRGILAAARLDLGEDLGGGSEIDLLADNTDAGLDELRAVLEALHAEVGLPAYLDAPRPPWSSPAPWRVVASDRGPLEIHCSTHIVATLTGGPRNRSAVEDADLIAAAPLMLRALEAVVRYYTGGAVNNPARALALEAIGAARRTELLEAEERGSSWVG